MALNVGDSKTWDELLRNKRAEREPVIRDGFQVTQTALVKRPGITAKTVPAPVVTHLRREVLDRIRKVVGNDFSRVQILSQTEAIIWNSAEQRRMVRETARRNSELEIPPVRRSKALTGTVDYTGKTGRHPRVCVCKTCEKRRNAKG